MKTFYSVLAGAAMLLGMFAVLAPSTTYAAMTLTAPSAVSPTDGTTLTTATLTKVDWSDVSSVNAPVTYIYEVSNSSATNADGSFVTSVYTSGVLTDSEINTPGTADGTYYWNVMATDNSGDTSPWSTPTSFTISNTPINHAPVATGQSVSTNQNAALPIVLSATDADSDTLSYGTTSSPTNGVLTGTAPNLTYTPNTDYTGTDSFTFEANDGTASSTPATINITVNAVASATVYVDGAAGSDSNSGSQTSPFKTIGAAINAVHDGGTVTLASDVTVTSEITINKALTLDGAGHTLFAPFAKTDNSNNAAIGILHSDVTIKNLVEDGMGSTGSRHGINIFEAVSNVNLNDVTVQNNAASGVTINGSTVTVNNITTKNNAWGGINADQAADAIDPTVLTITGTSSHTETGPAIWRDDNSKNVTVNVNAQYSSQTYTHNTSIVGTIWGLNSAVVNSEAELTAAVANPYITTVTFGSDITINAAVNVTRAITVNGTGHTLHAVFAKTDNTNNAAIMILANDVTIENLIEDGTGSTNLHGINIYVATGVNLNDVTVSNNAHDGVVVNGSAVTVNSISTSNNGWDGIDVDLGSGVTSPAVLTVNGTSVHTETNAAIKIDDTTKAVSVVDTNNQYSATDTANVRTYVLTPKSTSTTQSTGGGGGGSSGQSVAVTTSTTSGGSIGGGQVLGASAFNFTTDLTLGSTGDAVTALQQMLIDAGYLHIAAPTGTFGPLTQAAVKLYQGAHGIPATGFVGPLTRAALNAGTVTTADQEARAMLIVKIKAALADVLAKLMAIQAALTARIAAGN